MCNLWISVKMKPCKLLQIPYSQFHFSLFKFSNGQNTVCNESNFCNKEICNALADFFLQSPLRLSLQLMLWQSRSPVSCWINGGLIQVLVWAQKISITMRATQSSSLSATLQVCTLSYCEHVEEPEQGLGQPLFVGHNSTILQT